MIVDHDNQRVLELKNGKEELVAKTAKVTNSTIIAPCFIGENVVITNSVIGPHVSLEAGVQVSDSRISNSIIQADSIVKNALLQNSMLGKSVNYMKTPGEVSLGDFSTES